MSIPILLITGATSGLGLNTIKQLVKTSNFSFIVGVRNRDKAIALKSVVPAKRLTILPLDLASMTSVRHFASAAIEYLGDRRTLTAVALNAGIQITTGLKKSVDGYEYTFASNYLGHFLLTQLLLPVLAEDAIVVSTTSGTHDLQDRISGLFGFRGGLFPSAESVAKGILDTSVDRQQQCLDRYATSKLCNLLFTYYMANHRSPKNIRCLVERSLAPIVFDDSPAKLSANSSSRDAGSRRFLAFDPGLMPGTDLARDRSAVEQFAWKYLLPPLGLFVPGISSPERSSRSLSRLLTSDAIAPIGGQHFDYRLKLTPTSADSYREDWQSQLYDMSVELCGIASSQHQC